ncbi:hypothetical protein CHLNCDRAFT_138942 [Chlorella variabilis]|uniref:Uncharacterized protein n=1 Tax=Chlorella variabilis TaxID=554065 RepID=E1ZP00_CHLVA|nr:hypothetical protein CHLNCDRAFT_138942 [Chlorella variabilis]EFN52430.1 hypothetical protein CHLNCDRAFT_138942 [Chlorella variabilis]|eukprot:XP_005844532.1 hypothetical protein CHLNCDRAFT_138942 [Chlorella variabilis]
MVLLVNGETVEAAGLLEHPRLRAASLLFLAQPAALPADAIILYACQGEEATAESSPEAQDADRPGSSAVAGAAAAAAGGAEPPLVLSSSDATTCLIAALVSSSENTDGGGVAARIVHHDESTTLSPAALRQTVAGLGPRAKLWLAGAYADAGGVGARVSSQLLGFLQHCEAALDVRLCCVGTHNTAPDGSPRCTALALDLATLAACPAAPPPDQRGPLLPARMAQWACAAGSAAVGAGGCGSLRSIRFSPPPRQLRMELRHGRPAPHLLRQAAWLLSLDDQQLLEHWSTSPQHEPPHFPAGAPLAEKRAGCVQ